MKTILNILAQRWFIAACTLVVGFGAGVFFSTKNVTLPSDQREADHTYKFINPLLACGDENFSQLSNDRAQQLDDKINAYVNEHKAKGYVSDAAVYFRQLNGGYGLGVNSDSVFTPGSLLKVPLVMSVYLHAEKDPAFLQQQGKFEGGDVPAVEHFTGPTIQTGSIYSVEDLAQAALKYSDNNAAQLLTQIISTDELNDSYQHLGIKIPTQGQDYSMTVKVYASFFRILYNATYINHDLSEHLLDTLSQTTFKDGLVAGLPAGTKIAHKFGERQVQGENSVQLHDCGIVYHPKQPYLLCVMLRGKDFDALAHSIAGISKIAYEYAE